MYVTLRKIFIFLILCCIIPGMTQGQSIDSLRSVADTAQGKKLLSVYSEISRYYWKRNPFLSFEYAKKVKKLARTYPNDTLLQIESLHTIGDAYWYLNNVPNALEYDLKVLHLQEKINDSSGIAKTLNNLGVIYSHQEKYEKALELLERSLNIRKQLGETVELSANYINIGQIYYKLNEYDLAMRYFQRSVKIRENQPKKELLITGYNNIAAVHMHQKQYSNAVQYLNKALFIADSVGIKNQVPTIMMNLGDIFETKKDYENAIEWYRQAFDLANQLKDYNSLLNLSKQLAETYAKNSELDKAFKYSKIALEAKDSINARNTDSKIEQLQYQYNARQTQLENKALKQENELNTLRLNKEKNRINLLVMLSILALIIITLLINLYLQRIRHNKQLKKEVDFRTRSLRREINERKRLQSQTVEMDSRFASIFHNSPLGMVALKSDGTIQMANQTFQHFAKSDEKELQGADLSKVIIESDFIQKLRKSLEGQDERYEGKLTFKKNEKTIYSRSFFNHYAINESEIQGVFVTIEDISISVRAEERLRHSEQKFRDLADLLPEMLVETDLNANIIYANQQALKRFEFNESHIRKGLSAFDLFEPEDKALIKKRFEDFTKLNKDHVTREYNVTTRTGKKLSVMVSINVVYQDGKPERLRGILIDVSNRKQHEKELVKAKEAAEKADRLKSKFLQNLSHEIRTPMNGILGFSELIKHEEMSEEERMSYIDFIINSANQLLSIIDDVVNISRIESGDIKIREQEVSLEDFFNDLMVFFHGYLMNRNDQVSLRLQNKIENYNNNLIFPKKEVQHVLSNLIYNAIKFTKQGYIEIGVEKLGEKLEFYVKDTGIGIESTELDRIFDRFYQSHTEGKQSYGGTGLGLTIAKALVELIGGKIEVKSRPGIGSTFFFTIPFKPVKKPKEQSFSIPEKKTIYPDWSGKTLLVVEDDTNNYLFLEQLLIKTKASIEHVVNGKEAVEFVKNNEQIDAVLMDIQMPVMDGYDATRAIREFNKTIPILAQTANAMVEDKSKSLEAGCNDYVAKPVNKKVLLNKIGALLGVNDEDKNTAGS
mgnify:CR=1 FL=1